MTAQYSTAVKNARLDAVEIAIGPSAILKIRSGAAPVNCAAADTGVALATLNLPVNWMADASGGTKAKSGTWSDPSADATGNAGHFRIYSADGTTCGFQGTVTLPGGGGEITLDSLAIYAGQEVTLNSFSLASAN